jgi:ADP-heptose:LPS heptosyltransferase
LDKLGDMCITIPYLQVLKTCYPHAELTLLCSDSNAQFLTDFEDYFNVKLCDKIIAWNPPWRENKYRLFGLLDFFSLIKQAYNIRHEHYSIVIQPVLMGIETLFSLLVNSDRVFSCVDVRMPLSRCLKGHLDFGLERHGNLNFHLKENVLRLVLGLCSIKETDVNLMTSKLHRRQRPESGLTHISINISAGNVRRNLPYEHAEHLLNHLFLNYKKTVSVSLIGTADDIELSDRLSTQFSNLHNLVGKTTFKDLFVLLESVDLLITPDTGTMHIGSFFNVFMICIFGSGLVPFCSPVSNNCVIVKKELGCSGCMDFCFTDEIPPPCLKQLDPNLITLEVDKFLQGVCD